MQKKSELFFRRQSSNHKVQPQTKEIEDRIKSTLAAKCDNRFYSENHKFDAQDYAISVLLNEDVAEVTGKLEDQAKAVDGLVEQAGEKDAKGEIRVKRFIANFEKGAWPQLQPSLKL